MIGEATKMMIRSAAKRSDTPHEAAETLLQYAGFRTTKDRLEKFAGGRDLRPLIVEGLLKNDPSRKRDSADRNVRNWLRGDKDMEISRETAMELAFILELSVQDTDALLLSLTEEGIRWREPEEIITVFARMNGMDYPAALALKERLGRFDARADSLPVTRENMTATVKNDIPELKTEEELKTYLTDSAETLGAMHNTAYMLFSRFMKLLETPETVMGEEEDFERQMSVREILQVYLYRDLVPVNARKKKEEDRPAATPQQKYVLSKIKAGWPDEATLSKMKSREIDVNRKVLILLFMATDGAGLSFGKKLSPTGTPLSRTALFKESAARLNRMLCGCGYSMLDARSPFDWFILYCLSVDSIEETDAKMARTLAELFPGNQTQAGGQA